jgi:hypothetical protein
MFILESVVVADEIVHDAVKKIKKAWFLSWIMKKPMI